MVQDICPIRLGKRQVGVLFDEQDPCPTIIGGLAWLVVLVINQHVQYTNEDQS